MTPEQARAELLRMVAVLAAALALGALFPHVAHRGLVFIAGVFWINVVFGMSFNLLFGTSGILSFGQAMFYATGAYLLGAVTLHLPEVPFLLVWLLAGVAGGVLALLVGVVALRRAEGVYFAVLTLAFAALVHILITKSTLLGRNDGLPGIRRPVLELGPLRVDLASGDAYYYFLMVVCVGMVAVLWYLTHGRFGRTLRAIKQDPQRAAFLGIPVQRYRLAAFVVSGAMTAWAGALIGPWSQIVTPELAHWTNSTNPILYTLLGGSGSFWGAGLGAAILAGVFYVTRTMVGVADIVTGAMLLAVVLALPGGVMGLILGRRARQAAAEQGKGGGHG
jgi:branched-chain amino acid transport system permease protein